MAQHLNSFFVPVSNLIRRFRAVEGLLLALLIANPLAISVGAAAVPVIPGAAGYGITTPAGRGGTVYRVTNLNDSGTGSLRACVLATGPRVCVFEVSGYITLTSDLSVNNPFITIAGQTAPSPGITIRGKSLRIANDDVLVQHIRVRPGDLTACESNCNRDALKIEGDADRVVIDHVSLSFSIDETLAVWGPRTGVHIQNSLTGWPLHCSTHHKGCHGYGVIFGAVPNTQTPTVSFVDNVIANAVARHPLHRGTSFIANNLIYNRGGFGQQSEAHQGFPLNASIVGNVYMDGPSDNSANDIKVQEVDGQFDTKSKLYVVGNGHINHPSGGNPDARTLVVKTDQWGLSDTSGLVQISGSILSRLGGSYSSAVSAMKITSQANAPWVSGLTPRPASEVVERVTTRAGARPADRDWFDKRLVSDIQNASGSIINCVTLHTSNAKCDSSGEVAFAGSSSDSYGWPDLARNTRTLSLPANPGADSDGNGYTNLEEWLQQMAAEVEGGDDSRPMPPQQLAIE